MHGAMTVYQLYGWTHNRRGMIDPKNITNYNRNEWELQEFFIFCIAVAGKKSDQTALKVQELSEHINEMFVENPFYEKVKPETGIIHYLLGEQDEGNAGIELLRELKFGKYNQWEKFIEYFKRLKWWTLDLLPKSEGITIGEWLRLAPIELLERIPSVGKKTSRFFKLHSDPKARCVPLDTHILKFIKSQSLDLPIDKEYFPKSTPQSKLWYGKLEDEALILMDSYMKMEGLTTLAEADLAIWKSYAYK